MRKDEEGNSCPSTLGEYRDICAALMGTDNKAVEFLDGRIAEQGRDEVVEADDATMRALLMPMMMQAK